MKELLFSLLVLVVFVSCGNEKKETNSIVQIEEEVTGFFPVTSYLKGQIAQMKTGGVNPLMITTTNGQTDSAWLKLEQIDSAFAEFLTPEIDSANMLEFFKENKFFDQTVNAFTFTYEPKKALPSGMTLTKWDVYINPETNRIKRVYLEKTAAEKKELQLSWQPETASRIVYIATDSSGNQKVEKEVLIKWNFDEE